MTSDPQAPARYAGEPRSRERLDRLAGQRDRWTFQQLDAVGVGVGWRCLDVGAGAGSVARWLRRRVGPTGAVVATDIDTRFLGAAREDGIECRRHDIATDELEPSSFDLVNARLVLEHLRRPERAFDTMASALKPGGWLVVEDTDFSSFTIATGTDSGEFERIKTEFLEVLSRGGWNPFYGRRLGHELRARGLCDVKLEGQVLEWRGGDELASDYRRGLEKACERVVATGSVSTDDAAAFLSALTSPGSAGLTCTHVAARGRKPQP